MIRAAPSVEWTRMRSRVPSRILLVLLAIVITFGLVRDALAFRRHTRDGWLVGISLGMGTGRWDRIENGETIRQEVEEGIVPQWRVARMLGQRFSFGVEYQGWLIETGNLDFENDNNNRFRRSLQNWALALTWFPGNPDNAWGGTYVRIGVGAGLAGTAQVVLTEDLEQDYSQRVDEWGVGVLYTIGWELRIIDTMSAGVSISGDYLNIEESFVDKAWYNALSFTMAWYW